VPPGNKDGQVSLQVCLVNVDQVKLANMLPEPGPQSQIVRELFERMLLNHGQPHHRHTVHWARTHPGVARTHDSDVMATARKLASLKTRLPFSSSRDGWII
jgi:hypothetical protein